VRPPGRLVPCRAAAGRQVIWDGRAGLRRALADAGGDARAGAGHRV